MPLNSPRWKPARLAAVAALATALATVPVSAVAAERSGAPATAASPAYTSNQLNISMQTQQQDEWCWVASGNTIATYLGHGTDQNSFCDLAHGMSTYYQCPNQAGYLSYDQTAFQALGLQPGYDAGSSVSFQQIVSDIDANHPEETGISWTSGGGHAEVIYGYDSSQQAIYFADPWPSDQRYNEMAYSDYVSNYQFYWDDTLYGIGE